jgi:serine/threonine protein kinase
MNEEQERQFIANGRYALDRLLGKGGNGAVYLAYDTMLDRWVAIKRTPSIETTISREAKVMASFQHPNIVTMHDLFEEGDETIFVMELVLGQTLEDLLEPLNEDTFRNLAAQCLEGLAAAHEKNVVHRDIKPGNIMLAPLQDGRYRVKILDFGQSRTMAEPSLQTMDHSGAVVGSIFMMSPEQLSHEALDTRTDLYSLGCVFYQVLTLQRPFTGSTVPEVITAHLRHHFRPLQDLRPDLPKALTDWVEKLFEFDRQNRPANSQMALESLKSLTISSKIHVLTNTTKSIAVVPAPVLKPIAVVEIPKAPIAVVAAVPSPSSRPVRIDPVISTPTVVKPAASTVFSPIVSAVPAPVAAVVPTPSFAAVRVEPIAQPVPVAVAVSTPVVVPVPDEPIDQAAPEDASEQEEQAPEPEPETETTPSEQPDDNSTDPEQVYAEPIAEEAPVVAVIPAPVAAPARIEPISVAVPKPLYTEHDLSLPPITPEQDPAEPSSWDSTPPPASKNSPARLWIAIGAAVVLLAAGGAAGFMMLKPKLPWGSELLSAQDFYTEKMPPNSWTMSGDTLQLTQKAGVLWTNKAYENFQLDFEVQIPKKGNTGIFLASPSLTNKVDQKLEFELTDNTLAGSLLNIQKPTKPLKIADGNWHRFSIVAKGSSLTFSHNGKELYTCDFSQWTRSGFNPDGSKNHFEIPLKDLPLKSFIGFQGLTGTVKYRNIAIKEL